MQSSSLSWSAAMDVIYKTTWFYKLPGFGSCDCWYSGVLIHDVMSFPWLRLYFSLTWYCMLFHSPCCSWGCSCRCVGVLSKWEVVTVGQTCALFIHKPEQSTMTIMMESMILYTRNCSYSFMQSVIPHLEDHQPLCGSEMLTMNESTLLHLFFFSCLSLLCPLINSSPPPPPTEGDPRMRSEWPWEERWRILSPLETPLYHLHLFV